jgi:hypothetical protein
LSKKRQIFSKIKTPVPHLILKIDFRNKRESANANKVQHQSHLKPPPFSRIKSNKPFGDVTVRTVDPIDVQVSK